MACSVAHSYCGSKSMSMKTTWSSLISKRLTFVTLRKWTLAFSDLDKLFPCDRFLLRAPVVHRRGRCRSPDNRPLVFGISLLFLKVSPPVAAAVSPSVVRAPLGLYPALFWKVCGMIFSRPRQTGACRSSLGWRTSEFDPTLFRYLF